MKTTLHSKTVGMLILFAMMFFSPRSRAASFLELSDIENVSVIHESSSCLYGRCFRFKSASGDEPYWGHVFDRENIFYDKQTGFGPVRLQSCLYPHCIALNSGRRCGAAQPPLESLFGCEYKSQTGDNLFITYDGGQKIHIYLPSLSAFTELYVGSDGSTYFDAWLTQTAQEALPPTPSPTATVMSFHTPSPSPTSTPTPQGFHTPTPRPGCYCCPGSNPATIYLSDQSPSSAITYDSSYSCIPDPANLMDWWTSCTDWIEVSPPRGFGLDMQIYDVSISIGDTSSLPPGWHESEIVRFHDLCNLADVWVNYYKTSSTPGPTETPVTSPSPTPSCGCSTGSPTPTPSRTPSPTPTPSPGCCSTPVYMVLSSGDYNGDGTSDFALFRPSSGLWAIRDITRTHFGTSGDLPVPGDYNGDGTAEMGVFQRDSGRWTVQDITRTCLGSTLDRPVPSDFDGDSTCDRGIFRSESGLWAIPGVTRTYFGTQADLPAPGDFNGDGSTDIAVLRAINFDGFWAIRNISRFFFWRGYYGIIPQPGDYDGDGIDEAAVYGQIDGLWMIRDITSLIWGRCCDSSPAAADYDGDSVQDVGVFNEAGWWAVKGLTRVYFGSTGDIPVTR